MVRIPEKVRPGARVSPGSPLTNVTQGKANLNLASKSQLESLPGIGPTLAQRIIDYRNKNGFFKNIEELKKVSGIGKKKFEGLKDLISAN
jgi:competence protein ComEA